jgi:hypothetical protein
MYKIKNFSFYLILIINLHLFKKYNCHFFKGEKINLNESLLNKTNNEKLKNTDECLVSESEARIILKEKYNINPDNVDIDQNMRFILGKCHPIIYVPALFASRLVVTINCPVFRKNFLQYVKMRLFCGNTICSDDNNKIEEYVIFPAVFDSPFQIRVTENVNKFTGCQAYFFSYYNSKKECPEGNCEYSDGVRISFYGGTKETKSESKCGIHSQENLIYAGKIIPQSIVNQIKKENGNVMINNLRKIGHKEGFSCAGISYDYRRYIHSYKYFESALEYEINRLYRNTGKSVVILTTSHGGLFILNELNKLSPEIKRKIKCFVPIVPPFAGSSHLIHAYLYGLGEFDSNINILDIIKIKIEITYFSESLYFSSTPVIGELRPQYGIIKALSKPEYAKLKLAIEELIEVEKQCWNKNCESEKVKNMTKNYYDVFGDDFPSLDDEDCKLDENELLYYKDKKKLKGKNTRRCITNVYDVLKCPFLLFEKDYSYNVPSDHMRDLCGVYNSSLLYLTEKKDINSNIENKVPIDTLFDVNGKYPFDYAEFDILLDEYNKLYANKYNKTFTKKDFETKEEFNKRGKRNIEHIIKNGLIQDLPIPPVDTYLIYGNYYDTDVGFVFDSTKDKSTFDGDEYLTSGGDGTVPNFSTLLTGMKWLYDKKINNLTQNIKLIEYCSVLGKEGNKYSYNTKTFKNKTFVGLSCSCLNPDYKSFNDIDCTHASIVQDEIVLDMIKKEIIYDENNLNIFNEEKRKAIKLYNKSIDYEQTCNEGLYYLNTEDMDPIDWF